MTTKESNEAREIAELHRLFPLQKGAFVKNPYPSYEERLADLEKIKELVLKYQEDLIQGYPREVFGYSPEFAKYQQDPDFLALLESESEVR